MADVEIEPEDRRELVLVRAHDLQGGRGGFVKARLRRGSVLSVSVEGGGADVEVPVHAVAAPTGAHERLRARECARVFR